jgi:hypothetical protein
VEYSWLGIYPKVLLGILPVSDRELTQPARRDPPKET